MTDCDDAAVRVVSDRLERRLAEVSGQLRVEMANLGGELRVEMAEGFGTLRAEMANGFGKLRTEMSDRNAELLKWALIFGATQTAALAAVITVLR